MKQKEHETDEKKALNAEAIQEATSQIAAKISDFIKKHPIETVGGALLLGFLVGRFSKRNRD